ncbi:MAG: hypothetical protein K9J76_00880 [Polaromonas sp.]|nr:hypothetical protein [Polaromonas sp.]
MGKSLHMLLSGTRRKVLPAAVLASGAALTLLDEPFSALDRPSVNFLHEVATDAAHHPRRAFVIADHQAPWMQCLNTDLEPWLPFGPFFVGQVRKGRSPSPVTAL